MSGLAILIPCALGLGVLALAAFYWSLRSGQFDDIEGAGQRVLLDFPGPAVSRSSEVAEADRNASKRLSEAAGPAAANPR